MEMLYLFIILGNCALLPFFYHEYKEAKLRKKQGAFMRKHGYFANLRPDYPIK